MSDARRPTDSIEQFLATATESERKALERAAALDEEYGDDFQREIADRNRERGNRPPAWRSNRMSNEHWPESDPMKDYKQTTAAVLKEMRASRRPAGIYIMVTGQECADALGEHIRKYAETVAILRTNAERVRDGTLAEPERPQGQLYMPTPPREELADDMLTTAEALASEVTFMQFVQLHVPLDEVFMISPAELYNFGRNTSGMQTGIGGMGGRIPPAFYRKGGR